MRPKLGKTMRTAIACGALMTAGDALALRCGNRLITEGMPEAEVVALCGRPVSTRYLGYILRPHVINRPAGQSGLSGARRAHSGFHEEVLAKEMLFNFGPRKLMRLVRFEDGHMVSIETAGYGHRAEKE